MWTLQNMNRFYAEAYEKYWTYFDRDGDYVLRGDKSPGYSLTIKAAEHIHEFNQKARILWTLRNPVERAITKNTWPFMIDISQKNRCTSRFLRISR